MAYAPRRNRSTVQVVGLLGVIMVCLLAVALKLTIFSCPRHHLGLRAVCDGAAGRVLWALAARRERRLKIMCRVGAEGDMSLCAEDAGHLVESVRHDFGHLIMVGHPDHGDQVDRARPPNTPR